MLQWVFLGLMTVRTWFKALRFKTSSPVVIFSSAVYVCLILDAGDLGKSFAEDRQNV